MASSSSLPSSPHSALETTCNPNVNVSGLAGRIESLYGLSFTEYNGFYFSTEYLEATKAICDGFQPRADDIFLCSSMKTGTTWIMAILAGLLSNTNLLKENSPHDLIHTLEIVFYGPRAILNAPELLTAMPSPRVLHTHIPYNFLPQAIKSLGCRVIYIARNPKDTFVSYWNFLKSINATYSTMGDLTRKATYNTKGDISKEAVFDGFCRGVHHYGPYLDHVLGFWNASRNDPNILFLTYEELMADTSFYIRRIADFLGRFSLTEEDIDRISVECSFEYLSGLDVNKSGTLQTGSLNNWETKIFFRKGRVGDWKNHFTSEMNSRLDSIVQKRLEGSGFCFRYEIE